MKRRCSTLAGFEKGFCGSRGEVVGQEVLNLFVLPPPVKYLQFGSRDTEEERCGEMRKLEKF